MTLASCKDASLSLVGSKHLEYAFRFLFGWVQGSPRKTNPSKSEAFLDNPHATIYKPNQDTLLQMTRDVVAHGNLKHLLASVLNLRHHAKAHGPMLHQRSTNGSEVTGIQLWKEWVRTFAEPSKLGFWPWLSSAAHNLPTKNLRNESLKEFSSVPRTCKLCLAMSMVSWSMPKPGWQMALVHRAQHPIWSWAGILRVSYDIPMWVTLCTAFDS